MFEKEQVKSILTLVVIMYYYFEKAKTARKLQKHFFICCELFENNRYPTTLINPDFLEGPQKTFD